MAIGTEGLEEKSSSDDSSSDSSKLSDSSDEDDRIEEASNEDSEEETDPYKLREQIVKLKLCLALKEWVVWVKGSEDWNMHNVEKSYKGKIEGKNNARKVVWLHKDVKKTRQEYDNVLLESVKAQMEMEQIELKKVSQALNC